MTLFQKLRPRDINVEAGVSSTTQELTYYVFNDPALNTFSEALAKERENGAYSIVNEVRVRTEPLRQLLDAHLAAGIKIDLMTIDAEGLDYDVLQSNDWARYSPDFILVECIGAETLEQANSHPVAEFLRNHRYAVVAKTKTTVLFGLVQA
jgi:hypothetical protein